MSRPCIIICNFNDKEAKLLKTYGSIYTYNEVLSNENELVFTR